MVGGRWLAMTKEAWIEDHSALTTPERKRPGPLSTVNFI